VRTGTHAFPAAAAGLQKRFFGESPRRSDEQRKVLFKASGGFLEILSRELVDKPTQCLP